jgi:hypothetical protein
MPRARNEIKSSVLSLVASTRTKELIKAMGTQVKICGVTNVADALAAAGAGADMIGLNFYDGSPRHVISLADRGGNFPRAAAVRAARRRVCGRSRRI